MSGFDSSEFSATPFTPGFARYNPQGRWLEWNGRHVPETFAGLTSELEGLRTRVVLEDKSPMSKYRISGKDACAFLNYVMSRDARNIEVNHAYFTPFCREDGKLIEELPVFRLAEDTYLTTGIRMEDWFRRNSGGFDIVIEEVTDQIGVLTCQGPSSRATIEAAAGADLADLRFARGRRATIGGVDVHLWRLGYTGGLGYEVFAPADGAMSVFDALMDAGAEFGIQPWGVNAVLVARVEAGFLLPGLDYRSADPTTAVSSYETSTDEAFMSPFEVGLARFVDLDKDVPFIGQEALRAEIAGGGPRRAFVGLVINWRDIVAIYEQADRPPEISRRIDWTRYPLWRDGERVGTASSVVWSPNLDLQIAFGQIDKESSAPGTEMTIKWEAEGQQGDVRCTVVELPFIDRQSMYSG